MAVYRTSKPNGPNPRENGLAKHVRSNLLLIAIADDLEVTPTNFLHYFVPGPLGCYDQTARRRRNHPTSPSGPTPVRTSTSPAGAGTALTLPWNSTEVTPTFAPIDGWKLIC